MRWGTRGSCVALGSLLILGFAGAAVAREKESYCTWKEGITGARIDRSDRRLHRSTATTRIAAALAEHLPFGMPSRTSTDVASSGEILLAQPHFLIWYDKNLRAPLWTAHHLTDLEAGISPRGSSGEKRRDSFRSDPRLDDDDRSKCRDYKEPIFDQGHMVPNGDLDFVTPGLGYALGMDHSFLMSNMTPQHCAFNRGPWQVLEGLIRDWAENLAEDTWIITGAVFDRDGTLGRDPNSAAWLLNGKDGRRVAIPSHLYKIVAQREEDGSWGTLTLLIENTDHLIEKSQRARYLGDRVVSLDDVADASGFRFMDGESVVEYDELWPVTNRWPGLLTSGCKKSYPDR